MVTDAFGVVAMVAMTPLITIQILGVVYQYQERKKDKDEDARRADQSTAIGGIWGCGYHRVVRENS